MDIREELVRRMLLEAGPSNCKKFIGGKPCIEDIYGLGKVCLSLDSAHRDFLESDPGSGRYVFSLNTSGDTGRGAIGATRTPRTVTQFKIGSFFLPQLFEEKNPETMDNTTNSLIITDVVPPYAINNLGDSVLSGISQIPYRRVVVMIEQTARQSFSGDKNTHFNFEFDVDNDIVVAADENKRLKLTPITEFQYFPLTSPLTELSRISVQFYNPFYPLKIPEDTFINPTATSVINPVGVPAGTYLLFTVSSKSSKSDARLINGDRIFIEGFKSNVLNDVAATVATATRIELETWINRQEGHLINVVTPAVSVTAPTYTNQTWTFITFPGINVISWNTIGPASTSFRIDDITTPFKIIIAKNRIRIPIEVTDVLPEATNYKY